MVTLRMVLAIAAAALLAPTASLHSQRRHVVPGDVSVQGSRIEPYTNAWRMIQRRPDGTVQPIGSWLDSVDVVLLGGVEYLRRIQTSLDREGGVQNRQVHIVNRASMVPHQSHTDAQGRTKQLAFGPQAIVGSVSFVPGAPAMEVRTESPAPAFDFEIAGVFLVALYLQPGDTVEFPSYTLEPTGMTDAGLPKGMRVVSESITAVAHAAESVRAGSLGELEATRVVVPRGGRRTLTFWLAEQAPYIVRLSVTTPRGTIIWEML